MLRFWPVTHLGIDGAPHASGRWRFSLILLLGATALCAASAAAPATKNAADAKPVTAQIRDTKPSDLVGAEVCASCHQEVAKGFESNPHTKMAQMHGSKGVTCENCHGAGKAHVEGGGDVSKIFSPAKATSKQLDATCLECHAGTHPNFERSPYAEFTAYGRSKTANVLFAVEFDRRHKARGIRATAVHPGTIRTELGRHMGPGVLEKLIAQISASQPQGAAPFSWKSIPQGAATSVWAGCVADAAAIGGRYCEDCHVAEVASAPELRSGVQPYALDPVHAQALWRKSEEWVDERFDEI